MADVGRRLRELREERGLTQEQLARRSGVARNTITRVEAGTRGASADTVDKVARGLEVDPGELFVTPGGQEASLPKDLSLSSLGLRRWLRERGFKYALMSKLEFGEHVVDQDPEVDQDTGIPVLVDRISQEITEERDRIERILRKENTRRGGALDHLLPGMSPTRRSGAIHRFVHGELADHYADLDEILIQFSHVVADRREAQGKSADVLAPSPRLARTWFEQAMNATLDRMREQERVQTEA